ncbi:MAG: site-2 protease family protein [candidate division WOR-3 bacterium]
MDLGELLISLPAILFGLTIHEFSHGYVAYLLGDPTARYEGRLTLNPLKHLDPIGTILLILPWTRFGWARPVPINPNNFRRPLRDMAITAVAGPLANFLLAIIAGLTARLLLLFGITGFPWHLASSFVIFNLILGFFNLLPIPPLDGSRLVYYLLPRAAMASFSKLERQGFLGILVLFLFGAPLFRFFLYPVVLIVARFLLGQGVWI